MGWILRAPAPRGSKRRLRRPGYGPGDLLKLYIYGYLNRVRSSRRLEREAQRTIELIWLLRGLAREDFFKVLNCAFCSAARF